MDGISVAKLLGRSSVLAELKTSKERETNISKTQRKDENKNLIQYGA